MAYTTADAKSNFKVLTYSGNGSTNAVTGVGFQPDFVWVKSRDSSGYDHNLYDSVRGVLQRLKSQNNAAQDSNGKLSSFDANGFSVIAGGDANGSGQSMVAWCWKGSGFQPSQTFSDIKTQGLIAHWNATQSASLYADANQYRIHVNLSNLLQNTAQSLGESVGGQISGDVEQVNACKNFF